MGMTMSFIMRLIMIEVVSDDELLECLRKVCIESFLPPVKDFPCESPLYMSAVIEHIDNHCSGHCCESNDTAMLVKAELLDDVLPKLEEMSFHIAVKDSIRHYVEDLKEHPAADATHFLFDYKASVCHRHPCYLIQCVCVDFASNFYNHEKVHVVTKS